MAMDDAVDRPLRVLVIPFLAMGHMIPTLDIAKLLACRPGVAVTVLTTPGNEPLVRPTLDRFKNAPALLPIELALVPFPASVAHLLPSDGSENQVSVPSADVLAFHRAFGALQGPFEQFIRVNPPDCIVSDAGYLWSADLRIPRIVFYGHGIFTHCLHDSILANSPHTNLGDDSATFVVDGLPRRIEMRRGEVLKHLDPPVGTMLLEAERKSYGVVVNSFYELEPEFADHYRGSNPERKAYFVGPVSLSSRDGGADRGKKSNEQVTRNITEWLAGREEGSVVYVCFGSLNEFSAEQLRDIALGLEESGHCFVWAVKGAAAGGGGEGLNWMPKGFEERNKGKGMVIRGWAPQTVILDNAAVGGFLTHCGWNSTMESVTAGVPMVTWPVEYDQFANEKLITEVLEVGVRVERGEVKRLVRAEAIAAAVREVMGEGEAAERRRARLREYAAMARAAAEEGGSSYVDVGKMVDDMRHARSAASLKDRKSI